MGSNPEDGKARLNVDGLILGVSGIIESAEVGPDGITIISKFRLDSVGVMRDPRDGIEYPCRVIQHVEGEEITVTAVVDMPEVVELSSINPEDIQRANKWLAGYLNRQDSETRAEAVKQYGFAVPDITEKEIARLMSDQHWGTGIEQRFHPGSIFNPLIGEAVNIWPDISGQGVDFIKFDESVPPGKMVVLDGKQQLPPPPYYCSICSFLIMSSSCPHIPGVQYMMAANVGGEHPGAATCGKQAVTCEPIDGNYPAQAVVDRLNQHGFYCEIAFAVDGPRIAVRWAGQMGDPRDVTAIVFTYTLKQAEALAGHLEEKKLMAAEVKPTLLKEYESKRL